MRFWSVSLKSSGIAYQTFDAETLRCASSDRAGGICMLPKLTFQSAGLHRREPTRADQTRWELYKIRIILLINPPLLFVMHKKSQQRFDELLNQRFGHKGFVAKYFATDMHCRRAEVACSVGGGHICGGGKWHI